MDEDDALPDATPDRDYDTLSERPMGLAPGARPKVPSTMPPPGACDAHLHLLDGSGAHALAPERPEDPAEGRGLGDWIALLRTHLETLGLGHGVLVQSLLHGADNAVLVAALEDLGENFRGIGLLRDDADESALEHLARARFKGLRHDRIHGALPSWDGVERFAPMLAARDMHLEVLLDAEAHLPDMERAIRDLPVPVVFGHLGWPDLARGPDAPGFERLCALLGDGRAWVKLSGIYRFCDAPYEAADALVARLVAANPERCLWGSDWPHLMLGGAQMPDAGILLDAFFRAVPESRHRQRILVDNPAALYGF